MRPQTLQPRRVIPRWVLVLIGVVLILVIARWRTVPQRVATDKTFLQLRESHVTKLLVTGPSPQQYENEELPKGVRQVLYTSGDLKLKAWYLPPRSPGRHPALVFYHGGFAFGMEDLAATAPFTAADFAVLCPSLRGENGNPGHHELFYGELDDARAALRWMAQQPEVDPAHIYTFGHSAGGVLSALLSLYPDCGARLTGSAGGLYDQTIFRYLDGVPFNTRDPLECQLRILPPNASQIKLPHIAYLGEADRLALYGVPLAESEARKANAPLTLVKVPGDHFASFDPALKLFFKEVQKTLTAPPRDRN
jgi:dienelactone hydrolase